MKHKTSELEGALLDAAVAKAEGLPVHPGPGDFITLMSLDTVYAHERHFSRDWAHGGPIIERELIEVTGIEHGRWIATPYIPPVAEAGGGHRHLHAQGPTPLIAAMRAFVASRFGDELELP